MHAIFIARGIKQALDHLSMDMQAQKHCVPVFNKSTGKTEHVWVQGALRPIQLFEYVFPEEDKDIVLTTLDFDKSQRYGFKMDMAVAGLRKMLGASKIPKFDTKNHYLWIKDNVEIVPIGVKYDDKNKEFDETKDGQPVKTIHEAL